MTNVKEHSAKNVYIRGIAPAKYDNKVMFRVFTDDVLEIIPILMKLQKTPLDPNDSEFYVNTQILKPFPIFQSESLLIKQSGLERTTIFIVLLIYPNSQKFWKNLT